MPKNLRYYLLMSLAFCLTQIACTHSKKSPESSVSKDKYDYLMDVQSAQSLKKVNEMNSPTLKELESDPSYSTNLQELTTILESKERIPKINLKNGFVYNLWQDNDHVKGLWRRSSLKSFSSGQPDWTILIDVDQLAKNEKENWVFKNAVCAFNTHCMIELSKGGKDATVIREYDLGKKAFVADGFSIPEAKSEVAWVSADQILVASDFGKGSLTDSGYARTVRSLTRGQKYETAKLVHEGIQADMGDYPVQLDHGGQFLTVIIRKMSFRTSEFYLFKEGQLIKWELPIDFEILGFFKGQVLGTLRSDLQNKSENWPKGSLVAFSVLENGKLSAPTKLFSPNQNTALIDVKVSSDSIYANILKDVSSQVLRIKKSGSSYTSSPLSTPSLETISFLGTEGDDPELFYISEGFLKPSTLYVTSGTNSKKIKSLNPQFNSKGLVVKQLFAVSTDQTRIPYFWIGPKNSKTAIPTLQYGYGGFEIPEVPFYWTTAGKAWLEKGGALVVANIRGGGEYGPRWHQAALREKRQVAFDDFASVSKDLIKRKLTTSAQLGIMGGSNGGLLVGTSFVQNPELYGAVVCAVPLLDMLTFHRYLAGASWMEEYGNPDTHDSEYISRYSPYQNVKAEVKYPEVFFVTSTLDDRVHPGHARKMAAKMTDMGHKIYYFENTEGGHAASSNLKQKARIQALEYTYLWKKLRPSVQK